MKSMDDMMTYVSKNKTAIGYYQLVLESFFGDICREFANNDINAFQELLDEEILDILFPVMWEFFYTNIYGEDKDWNLLDKFLTSPKSKKISPNERNFLERARTSIFSVYKILSVDKDTSFTVKDMIKNTEPMTIREKSLTNHIKKGDIWGLRVVDMQDHYEITGGVLQLSNLGNTKIKAMIHNISAIHEAIMMIVQSEKDKTFNQIGKDLNHISETMWSVMIAEEWMRDILKTRKNILSSIKNRDGHLVQSVKLIFPITDSVNQKFYELLEKHKQIEADGNNSWLWLDRKNKKEKLATILGHLTIEDSCLVAYLNSQQRANILEDMLQNHLKEKIGKPQQISSKENLGSIEALMKSININSNHEIHDEDMISLEEQHEIIHEYKDAHYKKWISSRIPALGNKTPRMAKKTKEGKRLLIDLLIEMQASENEQAKINKQKAYDFSWIWEELNLELCKPISGRHPMRK